MTLIRAARATLRELRSNPENPSYPLTSQVLIDMFAGTKTDAGVFVNERSAQRVVAVYRAWSLLAGTIGSLPVRAFTGESPGGQRWDGDAASLLAYPGGRDPVTGIATEGSPSAVLFYETLVVHLLSWGNAYVVKIPNVARSRIVALDLLQPSMVTPRWVRKTAGNPTGKEFVISGDDGQYTIATPRDVIHIRAMGQDLLCGISPIGAARQALGLAVAAEEYGARLFGSGNLMAGILQTDQRLQQPDADRLRDRWRAKLQGLASAYDVAVLDSGAKWQPIGIPPQDSQFIQSREFGVTEVARLYGIPPHMLAQVEKSTCIPKGVQVFTVDGPRSVEDVRVGEMVWSLDSAGKRFVSARVWRSEKTGHDPILNIRTRARVLRCNAQHRVLVRRKHPAPRPGPGGYHAVEWRNAWLPAGAIKLGDYLVALNGLPDGKSREAPNGRVLTEGFMAFAGLLLGDGTVNKGSVSVARHRDAPYMPRYVDVIQQEFHCATMGGVLPYELRPTRPVLVRDYERCATFSSLAAAAELRELGLSGTARTKRVPDWVYKLTPDLIAAYLSGYIDSDGAVNERGWVTFSSCNETLLEDVRHLCMAIGVPVGTVRRYDTSGQCVVNGRTVTRGVMFQLFAYDVESNRKLQPYHPVKSRRLQDAAVSMRTGVWSSNYCGRGPKGSRPGETFRIDGGALQLVHEITVEPAEDVYDLGVAGTHSFIADGLVVHNSWGTGIEQQSIGFNIYTLRPWLTRIEQSLSNELLPRGVNCRFNVNELLRGDMQAEITAHQHAVLSGQETPNEARAARGLPPKSGGDELFFPTNYSTMRAIVSPPDLPAEPGVVDAGGSADDPRP